jgi:pyruvate/2-oxoglutarate dehydrogenase complex dihydrolipoamide dehydrogenase (E3) component
MTGQAVDAEQTEVDIVVLGLGPAGESVAGQLAEAGLSVAGVEERLVGGECPYWGCVPSKMMIRAGNALAEARRVAGLAGEANVRPDWSVVARRIREEATDDWDDQVAVDRFTGKGGVFVRGRGRITGPGTVDVEGRVLTARRGIVVATGSSPAIPAVPGLQDVPYWTNREAIEVAELPRSLLVLGGGAIGVELAQVYARFGVQVTVVEAGPRLVPVEEPEASELVRAALDADGAAVRVGVQAEKVRGDDTGVVVDVGGEELNAERLLVATGRRVNVAAVGLDRLGVPADARAVRVNERLRVADGVWAVGDVTGQGAFTHVGMYQADIAVRDILGSAGPGADYRAVPRVTFTDPEVGAVGLTEQQARDAGLAVQVGLAELPSSARGWIHKAGNEGLIKLVVDAEADVLVGATSAGPAGGEVLGMLALAVKARLPLDELRTLIYAYPTFHRAVEAAVHDLH